MAAAEPATIHEKLQSLGIHDKLQHFSTSNFATNPVDIFRSYIASNLSSIVGVDPASIYTGLEWTTKTTNGDLILATPKLRLKSNPQELAQKVATVFPKGQFIQDVKAVGIFVQFFFSSTLLSKMVVPSILSAKDKYGTNEIGQGQSVLVEFSSPNIAKPFHMGHLRSTIIGSFLSNLHEACGWKVVRMNYLGDWGRQFGLLAVGYRMYGSEEELKKAPEAHLYDVYVKINKALVEDKSLLEEARDYFRKMEEGDPEAVAIWKRFRDSSIEKAKTVYRRLNIEFDIYSGESQVPLATIENVMKTLEERKLLMHDEGAILVDLTPYSKKLGKSMVRKKDGTSLYLTRDIGAAMERYKTYGFDKMLYVVASQQDLHLAQLFKILELCGSEELAKKCFHITFGLVKGMSTRKGTAVFLEDILDQTKDSMHEVMKRNAGKYEQVEDPERTADLLGVAAVIVQDMSAKRVNNYDFSWDRMLSFEGDTGPYLQYAYSRLCSIERKANIPYQRLLDADMSVIIEPVGIDLMRVMATYPDVVMNALKTQEPSNIVTFLFKMTHVVSSCYEVLWVAGQDERIAIPRLALYVSARHVLGNGMRMLGLTPVERYTFF